MFARPLTADPGTRSGGIFAALAMVLLIAGVLSIAAPIPPWLVALALAGLTWLSRYQLNRPARIIAALVLLLYGAALAFGGPSTTEAMARMTFLSAFMIALGLLSLTAARSEIIGQAAVIVANRPRGARYVFVTLGTHVFAIFLNVGATTLMATLLAQGREALARQNATETLSLAVLRGFAAMPMWSPLALSTLITLSILPEVGYFQILPYGIAAAMLYAGAGYYLSRQPGPAIELERALPSRAEWAVLVRVIAIIAMLVALAFLLKWSADLSLPAAVLVAVLFVSAGWWGVQAWSGTAPPMSHDLATAAETGANEIVIVAGAGFLGALIAEAILTLDGRLASPPDIVVPVLVAAVPLLMVLAGLWAVNPIISASLLLGVLHPLVPASVLPWLALATILGWGLTAAASPFTANVLITTRIMDLEAGRLVRSGNLSLTVLGVATTGVFCGLATYFSIGR